MHGKITDIADLGTIAQVVILTDDGQTQLVNFDHRTFHHVVEGRGGIENIVGQQVRIDGDFVEETVTFLDDEEEVQ